MTSNNILITLDTIFDIDLALLKLIRNKYLDEEEFIFERITQPPSVLKHMLRYRSERNPLYDFVVNKEDADSYYLKFLEEKYDEILEYAEPTVLFELVSKFVSTRGVIITTILYNDKREEFLIDKFRQFGHINKILSNNYDKDIDLNKYDTLYIKDYHNILLFDIKSLRGKNVYISSNMYNMSITRNYRIIPNIDISTLCMEYNELHVVDLYRTEDYSEYSEEDEIYSEDEEENYDIDDFK